MAVLPNGAAAPKVISENMKRKRKITRLSHDDCPLCGTRGGWLFLCRTALTPGIIFYLCACWQTPSSLPTAESTDKSILKPKKFLEIELWLFKTRTLRSQLHIGLLHHNRQLMKPFFYARRRHFTEISLYIPSLILKWQKKMRHSSGFSFLKLFLKKPTESWHSVGLWDVGMNRHSVSSFVNHNRATEKIGLFSLLDPTWAMWSAVKMYQRGRIAKRLAGQLKC